ncbi:MAG TPA: magnesium transporter CorA family protein [Chloroflexi bacterium]|nr:magnesium transporter CorA family protein [Chloroflexota bacterium]
MIRSLYWTNAGPPRENLSLTELRAVIESGAGLLWLDLVDEEPAAFEPLLRDVFRFHPLPIEDALRELHIAKLDDWEDYIYLVMHALHLDSSLESAVQLRELDIFVGPHYMVTHHESEIAPLEHVWSALRAEERTPPLRPTRFLHHLLDTLVSSHMPVVEQLDDNIALVEETVFARPDTPALEQILRLKRAIQALLRALEPQLEVLDRLARDPFTVLAAEDRVYLRDTYYRAARLVNLATSMRDQAWGALDIYLSAVNNRMNVIIKTLTIITTVFMPLSFVTSFYGMNFFAPVSDLHAWTATPVFVATLVAMSIIPIVMYLWMRRQRWL